MIFSSMDHYFWTIINTRSTILEIFAVDFLFYDNHKYKTGQLKRNFANKPNDNFIHDFAMTIAFLNLIYADYGILRSGDQCQMLYYMESTSI